MYCQWVEKHTLSVREGHSVLLQVTCGFCGIVLEAHI